MTFDEIDDLETWQLAVALGIDGPEHAPGASPVYRTDADIIRARIAHREGRGPKPEAGPPQPGGTADLIGALGGMIG